MAVVEEEEEEERRRRGIWLLRGARLFLPRGGRSSFVFVFGTL